MTAIEVFYSTYKSAGLDPQDTLGRYMAFGNVYCEPNRLLIAHPATRDNPRGWCGLYDADTWFVEYAIGHRAIEWFLSRAPRFLPFVAFTRMGRKDKRVRVYRTERLEALAGGKNHG